MAAILLVEDDVLLADCFVQWLAKAGFGVKNAVNAQQALDMLDESLFDGIVMDLLLPNANGLQLLNALQSYADWSHIPVVICSNAAQISADDFKNYGVHSVLNKTDVTRRNFVDAIERAVARGV